jgi:LuxR family transcriptional regulator, regulator of acetate metabolism
MSGAPGIANGEHARSRVAPRRAEQRPARGGGPGSRRAASLEAVREAIQNLRGIDTVEELVALAPAEAGRLGFDRCLVSRISRSRWIGRSAYAHGDEELAEAMVEVGRAHPKLIDDRLIESDLVRRRTSLLVRDAQRNERVHPELKRLVKTESYVAAPIITRSIVVGFIHADTKPDGDQVNEVDRELLAMFSMGFSMALENLFYREQLDRIRASADTVNSAAAQIFGDAEATELTGRSSNGSTPRSRHLLLQSTGGALDQLTRREIEVLIHMADGETNQRIAARLFVSEATVKAHVKNILRKLGAGNRAEAVSRYFRAI